MYKIYQLQHINETYDKLPDGEIINYEYDIKLNQIGEWSMKNQIDVKKALEQIWDACNVSCWTEVWSLIKDEPVLMEDITFYAMPDFKGHCNSDILIETPDGLYKPEFTGWSKIDDLEDGMYRIIWSYPAFRWEEIRDKSGLDYNKLIKAKEKIELDRM